MADQTFCKQMLKLKDTDYSLMTFFHLNRGMYLRLFIVMTASACLAFSSETYRYLGLFLFGMFAGAFLRDLGRVLKIKKYWPLTVRITNWDVVRNIAEGTDSGS